MSPDVKKLEVDPPQPKRCRGSGEPLLPHIDTLAPAKDCKPLYPHMASFVPRPFPPPSLTGVPVEYIIDQLHNLAPHYWDKPQTADCTIIVPVPHPRGRAMHAAAAQRFPPESLPSYDPSGLGRRVTEPTLNFVPRISLKLHMDYLSAHSSFLRGLFSGASPLDLINSTSPPTFNAPSRTPSGQFTIPTNRLPRLLPSSPNHPVLFLPVPDPTSFHLLVHWMYFGHTNYIADCLNQGIIQWEGIARNVEYLGLPTEIKIFLGRWYGNWLHPERARYAFDDDSDTACSDAGDDDADDSSTASDMDEDVEIDDEKEPIRGRTRTTRPLSSIHDPRTRSA